MDANFWATLNRTSNSETKPTQYVLTPSAGSSSASLSLGSIEQLLFLERQRLAQSGFTAGFSNQILSPAVYNQLQTSISGSNNIYTPYQVIDANATQIIANQPQFDTLLKVYQQQQQQMFNNQTGNLTHKNETKSKNLHLKRPSVGNEIVSSNEPSRSFTTVQQAHNNRSQPKVNAHGLDLSQVTNKSNNEYNPTIYNSATTKTSGKSQQTLSDQLMNAVALSGLQWNGETFTTSGQQEVLLYEAVSPAATSENTQCSNFIDSLQFFGSSISNQANENISDVLPHYLRTLCESDVTATSQSSNDNTFDAGTIFYTDPSIITNVVASNPTQNIATTKSKSEIGIVLPIQQPQSQSLNSSNSSLTKTSKQVHSNPLITLPSSAYEQLLDSQNPMDYYVGYLANEGNNLVAPVSVATSKEDGVTDDSRSAIVLSNITGNVYINQYSMLQSNGAGDNETVSLTPVQTYDTVTGQPIFQDKYLLTNLTTQSMDKIPYSFDKNQVLESDNISLPYTGVKILPQAKSAFENSFLKFVAGQQPETLSSVTNSPIKNRPQLPKYIPDLGRSRVVVDTVLNKPIVSVAEESHTELETNPIVISSDIPAATKYPAKFSHKLQNRVNKKIAEDGNEAQDKVVDVSIMTSDVTSEEIGNKKYKWKKVISNSQGNEDKNLPNKMLKKLNSHLAELADQNDPNVHWTIAKKQKEQTETVQNLPQKTEQIPVLVIKAVTSKTGKPGRGRKKKKVPTATLR